MRKERGIRKERLIWDMSREAGKKPQIQRRSRIFTSKEGCCQGRVAGLGDTRHRGDLKRELTKI